MAAIDQLHVTVVTANVYRAGTDDDVYLGMGGREFHLSTDDRDDFQRGDDHSPTFTLGNGANIEDPDKNDPRDPQLDTEDLPPVFPVYIRKATDGDFGGWKIEEAAVVVNPDSDRIRFSRSDSLWLSDETGLIYYLKSDSPRFRVGDGIGTSPGPGEIKPSFGEGDGIGTSPRKGEKES